MDKTTEYYYKQGKVPKWVYNQLNGKTAQYNYNDYLTEQQQKFLLDKKELDKQLAELLESKLAEILKGFQI